VNDLRLAARSLRRSPGFLAVALVTMAIGIGASTALFSVVDGVLLRPLPYPHAERLVALYTTNVARQQRMGAVSRADFEDWRAQSRSFDAMAAFQTSGAVLGGAEPQHVPAARVSASFFDVFGVVPARGRAFSREAEEREEKVAVVTHAFWQGRMSADEAAVGRAVTLDGEPCTVVGVLPAAFKPPLAVREAQLFLPLSPDGKAGQNRGGRYLDVAARLRAEATTGQALAELATIAQRLEQAYPDSNGGRGVNVRPLHDVTVEAARPPIVVLFVAVTFLLLIAATNVAHLLLPRALARRHEVAVRVALGASRRRVARQLLTEIALLWLLGAAAGVTLATWLVRLIVAFAPTQVPRLDEVTVDGRVLAFGILSALAAGIAFGLLPALQATRVQPVDSLHGGRMPGLARRRLSGTLVAGEMALALVLLVGAGLVVESLRHLVAEPPGFDPDGLLTAEISLPAKRYASPPARAQFYASLMPRLAALPGVSEAGFVTPLPFSNDSITTRLSVLGRDQSPADQPRSIYHTATPGYFHAMRIPLQRGRLLADEDTREARPVVVVNESFARTVFPGEDPIGRRLRIGVRAADGDPDVFEIVGVAGDVHHGTLGRGMEPELYVPAAQHTWGWGVLALRTRSDPGALATAVRREVSALDPELAVIATSTMRERLAASLAAPRFVASLLSIFAAVAAMLAGIGLYGVLATTVAQRASEIGVRMALGARVADVLRLVVGEAARMAGVGIVVGLLAASAVTRLMAAVLFGIGPRDPVTLAAVTAALFAVALAAAVVPAWRAARIDPAACLRRE
jgi:putative ABC transport system permease protein